MTTARDGTMPILENWVYQSGMLWGNIFNDTRWADNTDIRTSSVKSIDIENQTAQTRNTLYKLGKPRSF